MPANSPEARRCVVVPGRAADLGHSWLLDLSYVGNTGRNEVIINDINSGLAAQPQLPEKVSVQARRPSRVLAPSSAPCLGHIELTRPASQGSRNASPPASTAGLLHLVKIYRHRRPGPGRLRQLRQRPQRHPSVENSLRRKADRASPPTTARFSTLPALVWSLPGGKGQWLLPTLTAPGTKC